MDNDNILSVRNLCKKYQSGKGIDNITFEVAKGTMVGIVGLNGAGKTTLLSSIIGSLNKDSGSIIYRFGENEATDLQSNFLNEIGIVMREHGFPEHFTALSINKIMKRVYHNWDEEKYFSILSNFIIDRKMKIKQYSTGMKSALSLAIALSHCAKLLVLDEIMDGLDILARKKVRDYLFDFTETGECTVLFTTHELEELEKIADSIVLIHHGRIVINSNKDDFLYQYKIFKVTNKQFSQVEREDIICFRSEEYFVSVLPKDTKLFTEKYKIESSWDSIEKIFEILLEGDNL
ncbi:MAG: ABC transporter ATP-binding protein [Lachnospiraceae bacterium]